MGMRPFWADYANHMLRFYVKNDEPTMIYRFKSRTDEKNWHACQRVMETLNNREREIIKFVYSRPLMMEDAVNEYLMSHPKSERDSVWNVVYSVSRRVAQMRGLL